MLGGLLGQSWDDPKTLGLLQLAASLQSSPKLMHGLSQGLLGYQGAMAQGKQAKEQAEMRALQRQAQEMQLQQQRAQMERQQGIDAAYKGAIRTPEQMAMGANGGPTMAAAQAAPGMAPGIDQNALIRGLMQADPMTAAQMLQPKPADYKVVGDALLQVGPGGVKEAYRAPAKAEAAPSAVKEYEYAKAQGYPGSYLDFQLAQKRAGAASVSVNTGQRGLDNTLKLRGDFRSEPVYKAHQEMQSAYSQIKQSLKQASPAGDLAGATKVMKLLDPGSVVRESELGMAMAATGLLDRAQNYASMVMSGNKLTPAQRKDFQNLADKLFASSVEQYNTKRNEYKGIAQRNQLSELDVLGPESSAPAKKQVVRTGTQNGRKVVQYADGTIAYADDQP